MSDLTIALSIAGAYIAISAISFSSIAFYKSYAHDFDMKDDEDKASVYIMGCLFWPITIVILLIVVISVIAFYKIPTYLAKEAKLAATRRADKRQAKLEALRQAVSSAEEANTNLISNP